MNPSYINKESLQQFITAALREDVGDGDHSSLAAIPAETQHRAKLLVKDDGILAGVELAIEIFATVDSTLACKTFKKDGDVIKKGDIVLEVRGAAQSILTAERLVLNCMQRMSGIATKTHQLLDLLKGTKTQLLDTRKTTPNFRLMEKWAVKIGGGVNHRIGLYDMIMLKDNHIDMAGGIERAIIQTKEYLRATNRNLKIEIETRTLEEVRQVLAMGGIDIIMLDNMSPKEMKVAVEEIGGRYVTEASGGITEENIREAAETGVDFISVGALTHSIKSLDLSLKAF